MGSITNYRCKGCGFWDTAFEGVGMAGFVGDEAWQRWREAPPVPIDPVDNEKAIREFRELMDGLRTLNEGLVGAVEDVQTAVRDKGDFQDGDYQDEEWEVERETPCPRCGGTAFIASPGGFWD